MTELNDSNLSLLQLDEGSLCSPPDTCPTRLSISAADKPISVSALQLCTYPSSHPYYETLHSVCDDLGIDRAKCFIYPSPDPNGFANDSGEIYLSEGLFRSIRSREELAAILAHELGHIEAGDLSILKDSQRKGGRLLHEIRNMEFKADLGEMHRLSAKGINPIGSLLLSDLLVQQENTAAKESKWGYIGKFLDVEHGTSETRLATQRESIRVRDYPGLSYEVTPINLPKANSFTPELNAEGVRFKLGSLLAKIGHEATSREDGIEKIKGHLASLNQEAPECDLDVAAEILLALSNWNEGTIPPLSLSTTIRFEEFISRDEILKFGISLDKYSLTRLWSHFVRSASHYGLDEQIAHALPVISARLNLDTLATYPFNSGTILNYIEGKIYNGDKAPAFQEHGAKESLSSALRVSAEIISRKVTRKLLALPSLEEITSRLGTPDFNIHNVVNLLPVYLGVDALDYLRRAEDVEKPKKLQCRNAAKKIRGRITEYLENSTRKLESPIDKIPHTIVKSATILQSDEALDPNYMVPTRAEALKEMESASAQTMSRFRQAHDRLYSQVEEKCKRLGFELALEEELKANVEAPRDKVAITFSRIFLTAVSNKGIQGAKQLRNRLFAEALRTGSKEIFLKSVDFAVTKYLESSNEPIGPSKMKYIRRCIDDAAKLRERLFNSSGHRCSRHDLASLSTTNSKIVKSLITGSNGSVLSLSKRASALLIEWPIRPVSDNRDTAALRDLWAPLEIDLENSVRKLASREISPEDANRLLTVFLVRPSDITGMKVAGVLFDQVLNSTDSFLRALNSLDAFGHLPIVMLERGIRRYLSEHKLSWQEISELRLRFDARASSVDISNILLGHHIGEITVALGSPRWARGSIALGLLTTGESDVSFQNALSLQWWKAASSDPKKGVSQAVTQITNLGIEVEFKRRLGGAFSSELFKNSINAVRRLKINWSEENVPSFKTLLNELSIAGPIFQRLFLREMLLGGVSGDLRSRHQILSDVSFRTQLLNSLITTYVADGKKHLSNPAINAAIVGVSRGPTSNDLFYYIGHALAVLAAQEPRIPTPNNFVPFEFAKAVRETARRQNLDYGRDTAGFKNTSTLLDALACSLFLEVPVKQFSYNQRTGDMSFAPPHVMQSGNSFKNLLHQKFLHSERGRLVVKGSSLVDLIVLMVEHIGALGKRYLQFDAMLRSDSYSEADREKIELSYDRSPLLDVVRVQESILKEAEKDPEIAAFVDNIDYVYPIEHGGSIFTVARVVDKEGRSWAVHIVNPNAEFLAQDLAKVAESVIDATPNDYPREKKSMAKAVLSEATTWTTDEVRDPNFMINVMDFTERYSKEHEDTCPQAFRQTLISSTWKLEVPEFKELSSHRVRIQRWFDGETLVRATIGETTSHEENLISKEDALEIGRLILGSFVHQLFETGVMHSNFHPGQFMYSKEKSVAILDTKNILRFAPEERETILAAIVQHSSGDAEAALKKLLGLVTGNHPNIDALVDSIQSRLANVAPGDIPTYVTAVLGTLYEKGVKVENRWMLLGQNLLGIRRIMFKLGIRENFLEVMGNGLDLKALREVFPQTSRYILGEAQ